MNESNEGLPRPDEFPVGSAESRAAARALLESREKGVRRVQVIVDTPSPYEMTKIGPWFKQADGSLFRTVIVPPGTDEETLKRILATP